MKMFLYVNFSRDRTLHATICGVNWKGDEAQKNERRGNDNEEIL
jgi:hypothetical protein